eukprot:gnl/MRDRNA2_/MRDRNA2_47353_c0_seq1.p1 gnl/MRDRNA2_/MRDRNA2_47353_c0~~gnl/MRDRNA2_/MRDRNA2_47353_c0_seq1.p1  ORF type:complete len:180 (-),score=10.15 gnl/MRDRNA2_/MRDRNA2_47353_c0_seq1:446-961(-)
MQHQVNHLDLDRSNNAVSNLQWVTPAENVHHSFENNPSRGRTGGRWNCQPVRARNIGSHDWTLYPSVSDASRQLGFSRGVISSCCLGKQQSSKGWEFQYDIVKPDDDPLPGELWRDALDPQTGSSLAPWFVSSFGRVQTSFGRISWGYLRFDGYREVHKYSCNQVHEPSYN